jgi:hypothetical protein
MIWDFRTLSLCSWSQRCSSGEGSLGQYSESLGVDLVPQLIGRTIRYPVTIPKS